MLFSACDSSAGSYISQNAYACVACPTDTYKPGDDQAESCISCPAFSSTNGKLGSATPGACTCALGYVGSITNSSDVCSACPTEVLEVGGCRGGRQMTIPEGLYKSAESLKIHRCRNKEQCSESTVGHNESTMCIKGSKGPLCGSCNVRARFEHISPVSGTWNTGGRRTRVTRHVLKMLFDSTRVLHFVG